MASWFGLNFSGSFTACQHVTTFWSAVLQRVSTLPMASSIKSMPHDAFDTSVRSTPALLSLQKWWFMDTVL